MNLDQVSGAAASLFGNEGGVVSEVINLESSGVSATRSCGVCSTDRPRGSTIGGNIPWYPLGCWDTSYRLACVG